MTSFLRGAAAALVLATLACEPVEQPTSPSPSAGVTQLQITDLRAGTGLEASTGRALTVRYTGWLYDSTRTDNKGTQFDSGTYTFVLGIGQVIRGWDQGLSGMRVGGARRLVIPPSLGYGSTPYGPIPGSSTLVFDCELLDVR
jgi:FKBP-type peptidyl-prolyl cis-trans isomerase FkpA